MSRHVLGCALAGALAMTGVVAAQDPPPQNPPQQTPTTRAPMTQDKAAVTVEGCLMREEDVPGRKPNVAERAGIAEDYILTSTRVIKGSAPAASASAGETPTGTSGMKAAMYKVEGIDDEKLKQHVGRRVQIEGTLENVDRTGATGAADLAEIRGTVIRQVAGDCPAK